MKRHIKTENVRYCCETFKRHAENKDVVGFHICTWKFESPVFILTWTAFDEDEADAFFENLRMKPMKEGVHFRISHNSQPIIDYCPWCGVKLLKYYKHSLSEFSPLPHLMKAFTHKCI